MGENLNLDISSTNKNDNKNFVFVSSVVLIPEESDDMWHAYNLIAPGDLIKASTIRKVKRSF